MRKAKFFYRKLIHEKGVSNMLLSEIIGLRGGVHTENRA